MNYTNLKQELAKALLRLRENSKKNSKGKVVVNEGEVKKEMNKFFKKGLPLALIAVVTSAMLAGCDLESQTGTPMSGPYDFTPSVTERAEGTDIVTDSEGYTHIVEAGKTWAEVAELSDWTKGNLSAYFADKTIEDVIDKRYSILLNHNLADIVRRSQQFGDIRIGDYAHGIESVQKHLMGNNADFAVHITNPRDSVGAEVTYYRKGADTSVFVIKVNGTTYLNGIYQGEYYTDGAEFLPENFSYALTEESASLLRQAGVTGAEYGDEIVASFIAVPDIVNYADERPTPVWESSWENEPAETSWFRAAGYGKYVSEAGSTYQSRAFVDTYVKFIRDGRLESIKFSGTNIDAEDTYSFEADFLTGYFEYQPQQSKIIPDETQK